MQYTANPDDPQSDFPGVNGQTPYSLLHLNTLYDLNTHCYTDATIQKRREANERSALLPVGSDGFYPISFQVVRFHIADEATETLVPIWMQSFFLLMNKNICIILGH